MRDSADKWGWIEMDRIAAASWKLVNAVDAANAKYGIGETTKEEEVALKDLRSELERISETWEGGG